MEIIRESNEDEMLLEFLRAEYSSRRFNKKLENILKDMKLSSELIKTGDISNSNENMMRRKLMKMYRGYNDENMFENFPKIFKWEYAECKRDDLKNIFYINYSYWNELSNNTGSCLEAANNIRNGVEIYNVSNQPSLDGVNYLKHNIFPPIILITCDMKKYLLLEGHSRLTVYGLDPTKFDHTYAYIGLCRRGELLNYDRRLIF